MASDRIRQFKVGSKIGSNLTVLGVVAKVRGRHPVYIVWNHRSWCPMACKVLRSHNRALREAEALQAVSHPNIVRVLGVEEPCVLLMEFLQGPTLEALMNEKPAGRLPLSEGLRAALHVGAALQHIHASGYLHLDVKPGNVIVSSGRPVLYDFGTARRIAGPRPDVVVGTDGYIAPEEARLEAVGPPADVFSFAASVYELLTGETPFPAATRARPYPQLTEPAAPMRSHVPSLPAALDQLVLRALALDPDQRPGLAELLLALNGSIRGGPRMWPADFVPTSQGLARVA